MFEPSGWTGRRQAIRVDRTEVDRTEAGHPGGQEGGRPSGWTARVIIDSYVASAHTELATLRTQIKRELTGPGREALTGLGSGPQATRRHDQVCYYGVRLWSAH